MTPIPNIVIGGKDMTNEVRRAEMLKLYGAVIKEMVKDSITFKGWKVVLKPTATELIERNRVRLAEAKIKDAPDTIHEKGLLECYVVLKRLAKSLNSTKPQAITTETKKNQVSK